MKTVPAPNRALFFLGFRHTLAFQPGVIPFGLLYASIAIKSGLSGPMVMLFSVLVFGGSSQLVFIDLLARLGSPFQAVLGANIVNTRHIIYSAGVSSEFSKFPTRWKLLLTYILTDQLYAFSESHKEKIHSVPQKQRPWLFFGSGFCTWIFWFASTGAGIYFGQLIPADWNLDFAIPLMFMPMLVGVCKTKTSIIAALFAVVLVFLFQSFPFGSGILFAILLASFLAYKISTKVKA